MGMSVSEDTASTHDAQLAKARDRGSDGANRSAAPKPLVGTEPDAKLDLPLTSPAPARLGPRGAAGDFLVKLGKHTLPRSPSHSLRS